jgi:hypothetical protein
LASAILLWGEERHDQAPYRIVLVLVTAVRARSRTATTFRK